MPIPGIRGMEHIGITVPDINQACDFFANILGAEVLFGVHEPVADHPDEGHAEKAA